jgi:hypothetical protein
MVLGKSNLQFEKGRALFGTRNEVIKVTGHVYPENKIRLQQQPGKKPRNKLPK